MPRTLPPAIVALLVASALAAPGWAQAARIIDPAAAWVTLAAPVTLAKQPGTAPTTDPQVIVGPALDPSPAVAPRDQEGLPVELPVLARAVRDEQTYIKVAWGATTGWIAEALATELAPDPLPRALRDRLDALMSAAGPRSGAVIADAAGRPLFSRRPAVPLILASNTKLFVTAAAFMQFGPAIDELLQRILPPSNNVLSQRLMVRLGDGDAATGALATETFAAQQGATVTLADGSGLDRRDRAAAADVVALLVSMRRQVGYATWRDALPVAGRSGTLAGRMRAGSAVGACQAKTGTLHDVSTLSGYCTTASGRRVVFSLLMNRITPWRGRSLQDRALEALTATA